MSIEEDSMLQKALVALGWEQSEQSGPSVAKAFESYREVKDSPEAQETYLLERTTRIREAGQSSIALEWLGKVLASDGLESDENWLLEKTRKLLFD